MQRHNVVASSVQLQSDVREEVFVRGREADLDIVFRNLIDNAVKYSLPEPHVRVGVDVSSDGKVKIYVTDNGPGIPKSQRQHVFRRFVRLGNELERRKPGTGLGLFLVRSVVKQLRGKVTVKSQVEEKGTVMEVELPSL